MVSSRSRLRRTVWYTALALSSVAFLLLPQASPARSLTDNTPPIVSYTIDGIPGNNNWFRGSAGGNYIVVHWTAYDPDPPGVTDSRGCEPAIQIPGPSTGTTRTCTATSAGGTTTITTRLLMIDATPPTTAANANRPPNAAGWYRSPLAISWSGSDATSGIASCTTTLNYGGPDTAGANEVGICTDNAGNSSSAGVVVRYDSTPPSTTASLSRTPNAAGWFRTPLSIGWSGADATSGLASCSAALTYGGPDTTGTAETGSCTDNAGNSSSARVVVKYDSTPPSTIASASRSPNAGGWYNAPLSVGWSGADATSGLAGCRATLNYGGPDTTGKNEVGSCTDNAGNSSSDSLRIKYDSTPPAFKALAVKALSDVVRLKWRLSGTTLIRIARAVATSTSPPTTVYNGTGTAFVDRRVENYVRYRYTLTATDRAGNTATRTLARTPMPTLFAPRPGAHLAKNEPALLAWRAVPKARYYNVQLWRGGRKVGSWWPSDARLRVPARWRLEGKLHRLRAGNYTWYVWPGIGARRVGRYGPLVGKSTFVVVS